MACTGWLSYVDLDDAQTLVDRRMRPSQVHAWQADRGS
jgi:hypothetical protein